MRRAELLSSRFFRIAALCATIFAGSFGVLVLALYLGYANLLKLQQERAVQGELEALETEYQVDGARSTATVMTLKIAADRSRRWTYLLQSPDGRALAGTLPGWPPIAEGSADWLELPSRSNGPVLARATVLPDGTRLLVGLDTADRLAAQRAALMPIVGALAVGTVLSLLVGAQVARTAQHPIEQINDAADRIMGANLSMRLPVSGAGDEFDRVAMTMNRMLDRIERSMKSVKGATDAIAHDLRTPLARLRLRLESLAATTADAQVGEHARALVCEVDGILDTFRALLEIATIESGVLRSTLRPVDLALIVADACSLYAAQAQDKGQRLDVDLAPAHILGQRDLLFAAVGNLLENAIKYAPGHTAIRVGLEVRPPHAHLSIADRGPGIRPEDRARALEPLVRLDPARHAPGFGLGLALVRAVCDLHDGALRLEDNAPGLRVALRLPLADPAPLGNDQPKVSTNRLSAQSNIFE